MAGAFSNDFNNDFDIETSEYQIRVRPVGSSDESVRDCFKYEWTVDDETQVAYAMPRNIVAEDVTVTELNATESADLADRIHAESEDVHGITFEKTVI